MLNRQLSASVGEDLSIAFDVFFGQKTPPSIDDVLTTSKGTTFYILVEPGEHGLLPETPDGIKSMKTCMTFLTDTQGTVRQS